MTTEQAEGLLWSVAQLLQHLRLSPPVWSKTKGAGVHGMEECACVRVSLCVLAFLFRVSPSLLFSLPGYLHSDSTTCFL